MINFFILPVHIDYCFAAGINSNQTKDCFAAGINGNQIKDCFAAGV